MTKSIPNSPGLPAACQAVSADCCAEEPTDGSLHGGVALLAHATDPPVISFHTADEHAAFVAASDNLDAPAVERETIAAARRAGAAEPGPSRSRRAGVRTVEEEGPPWGYRAGSR